jgi:hypothetical protein
MAVFHESEAASTGGNKKLIIGLLVAVALLCCCCVAVIVILVATGTITTAKLKDLTNQSSYLPLYLTLRTWL